MRQLALIITLALPVPALAQDTQDPQGPSLMEQGMKLFFRGLAEEMEPALRDFGALVEEAGPAMQSFLREMGPALGKLFEEVKDFSAYHPPEILPNGDIIMRRRTPPDMPPDTGPDMGPEPGPDGEIEI